MNHVRADSAVHAGESGLFFYGIETVVPCSAVELDSALAFGQALSTPEVLNERRM